MLYTSGTTGRPKGVRLSHAALAATVSSLEEAWRWRRDDRLLHVLPLHHTHGLIVALLGALWVGAEVRFLPFAAAEVWDALASASVFMAVPTIYAKLMQAFDAAPPEQRARWAAGAGGLRLATSGSAGLPATLHAAFARATGVSLLERYGMTEIGMALSNPYDGPRVPGAVGYELPGVTVDITDESGHTLPADEPGELRVRTTQMFSGYHGDPAATAASFDAAGRFRTGDTGVRDVAGVVRLLGRTSIDIIKSGGYKLSALEIEAVLLDHPAVAEVAVLGVDDATFGELVDGVGRAAWAGRADAGGAAGVRARAAGALQAAARAARHRRAASQCDGQGAEAAAAALALPRAIEYEYSPPSSAPNTTCAMHDRDRRAHAVVEPEEPRRLQLPHHRRPAQLAGHARVQPGHRGQQHGHQEATVHQADERAEPPAERARRVKDADVRDREHPAVQPCAATRRRAARGRGWR